MLDEIYLRPTRNAQGGHEVLHLASMQTITRGWVRIIPIMPSVISAVEHAAHAEGMKKFVLRSKTGVIM
jgi:hypothetical protein